MRIVILAVAALLIDAVLLKAIPQQNTPRSLIEEIRIKSDDSSPATMIGTVNSVSVASDGMIFIADRSAGRVRLYDANGKFVTLFGRTGEGPGEWRPNNGFNFQGVDGDTVRVQDVTMRHMLVFLRNGTYLRTEATGGTAGNVALRAYLGNGRSVVRSVYRPNGPPGPGPSPPGDSQAYLIVDSLRRVIARLAVEPHRDMGMNPFRNQGYSRNIAQPFAQEIDATVAPWGRRALVMVPYTRFGGNPGQVKLIVVTATGTESERVVDLGAQRLTPAIRDAWIRTRVDGIADPLRQAGIGRGLAEDLLRGEIKMPPYLPVYQEARLGGDGAIWIRLFQGAEWMVLPPRGAPSFRVRVPAGVTVEAVQADKMWGILRDADGTEMVVRYRVGSGG